MEILERESWEVTAVENAIAGLAEIQQHDFGAIICDYRLPFMGGESFFDEVNLEHPAAAKRFVFVTGYGRDPAVRDKLSSTGQPVLPKPFGSKDLIAAVKEVGS